MKKVDSFEHACELRGYDPAAILPDVSGQPEWLQKFTLASIKRVVIAEAIKEGKHPKPGEWSYFPVFRKVPSASAFVYSVTDYTRTNTTLGARLEFNTETESDFFGKNFDDLHRDVLYVTEG